MLWLRYLCSTSLSCNLAHSFSGYYDRKALWKSLPITVNTSSLSWQRAEVTIPATNVSYVIGFEGRISIPYKSDIAIDDVQYKVSFQYRFY